MYQIKKRDILYNKKLWKQGLAIIVINFDFMVLLLLSTNAFKPDLFSLILLHIYFF